jgi:spermidine synthase
VIEFAAPVADRLDEWLTPSFGYSLRGLQLLARERSPHQLVEIYASPQFGTLLRLDGAFQCSEHDEFLYHEPLVHMPMSRHLGAEQVLVIGGGDGGAAEEALKWPSVRRLDHVEIDAVVMRLCRQHLRAVHRGVLDGLDPRYRLQCGDGQRFVEALGRPRYDVLILDLTDSGGPSEPLWGRPFYEACARVLKPGGLMSLHVAAPWAQPQLCLSTLQNLRQVFPVVLPYIVSVPLSGGQWLMAIAGSASKVLAQGPRSAALSRLSGPKLRAVNIANLDAMLVLPPYIETLTDCSRIAGAD